MESNVIATNGWMEGRNTKKNETENEKRHETKKKKESKTNPQKCQSAFVALFCVLLILQWNWGAGRKELTEARFGGDERGRCCRLMRLDMEIDDNQNKAWRLEEDWCYFQLWCAKLIDLVRKRRMFPNKSVVVLMGLFPGLVLVVASDRRFTSGQNINPASGQLAKQNQQRKKVASVVSFGVLYLEMSS